MQDAMPGVGPSLIDRAGPVVDAIISTAVVSVAPGFFQVSSRASQLVDMPNPASVKPLMTERIYSLWDAMAAVDISDADDALRALLENTCQLLSAKTALCVVAVRMPQAESDDGSNWRPRHVTPLAKPASGRATMADAERRYAAGGRDICVANHAACAGTWRAKRLSDLAPPEWFKSEYYETFYTRRGLLDAIWVGCPINADVEIYIGIVRGTGQPLFDAEESDAALLAMRGLSWFLQRCLLGLGLDLATAPLTEAERKVLRLVLHGHSPKAIAKELAQSVYTTQEHIQAIYRKFNVSRRSALAALWTS
jgi:DNA-binding CsgD family transcriptional regulator